MKNKTWYEIYGKGPAGNEPTLLAKVKSKGLACIIATQLKEIYQEVSVR